MANKTVTKTDSARAGFRVPDGETFVDRDMKNIPTICSEGFHWLNQNLQWIMA